MEGLNFWSAAHFSLTSGLFPPGSVRNFSLFEESAALQAAIRHEEIRQTAAAFIANIMRVQHSVTACMSLVFWSQKFQEWVDEAHLKVFGDLKYNRSSDDTLASRLVS